LTENLPSGSININWQLYGPEDPSVGSYSNISMEDIQNMTHDEVLEHTAHISPVLGLPSPLIHRNQHMQIFPNHVNGLEAISSKIILHLDSFESWPRNIPHIVKVKEGLKNWNSDGMEMDLNVSSPWRVYSSGELAALHHYRFRSVPEFVSLDAICAFVLARFLDANVLIFASRFSSRALAEGLTLVWSPITKRNIAKMLNP
jgi:hypothetical protein